MKKHRRNVCAGDLSAVTNAKGSSAVLPCAGRDDCDVWVEPFQYVAVKQAGSEGIRRARCYFEADEGPIMSADQSRRGVRREVVIRAGLVVS